MYRTRLISSQTINSALNSSSVSLKYIHGYSAQVNISAVSSPSGALVKLQGSNDDSTWTDISGTQSSITGTGDILINTEDQNYRYARVRFEIDSGSFDAEVYFAGREQEI